MKERTCSDVVAFQGLITQINWALFASCTLLRPSIQLLANQQSFKFSRSIGRRLFQMRAQHCHAQKSDLPLAVSLCLKISWLEWQPKLEVLFRKRAKCYLSGKRNLLPLKSCTSLMAHLHLHSILLVSSPLLSFHLLQNGVASSVVNEYFTSFNACRSPARYMKNPHMAWRRAIIPGIPSCLLCTYFLSSDCPWIPYAIVA
jgi:hypothetical protein